MVTNELKFSQDVSRASWIEPRLGGAFGAVTRTVPSGFASYARICHPVPMHGDVTVSWAEVARVTGRRAHSLMQWHALVGSADPVNVDSALWPHGNPEQGNLAASALEQLCLVLARQTAIGQNVWFCLWEGYGWIHGSPAVAMLGSNQQAPAAFASDVISGPRVRLPGRDYLLFAGTLPGALQMGWRPTADWFVPQSPNLFWPDDHAWCVATEIDFDSTLVGGTVELINDILATPSLEARPIAPADSVAADADLINQIR